MPTVQLYLLQTSLHSPNKEEEKKISLSYLKLRNVLEELLYGSVLGDIKAGGVVEVRLLFNQPWLRRTRRYATRRAVHLLLLLLLLFLLIDLCIGLLGFLLVDARDADVAEAGYAGPRAHEVEPLHVEDVAQALGLDAQRVGAFLAVQLFSGAGGIAADGVETGEGQERALLEAAQLDRQVVHVAVVLVVVLLASAVLLAAGVLPVLEEPGATAAPAAR